MQNAKEKIQKFFVIRQNGCFHSVIFVCSLMKEALDGFKAPNKEI
jgi:hypothetical protein